MLLLLVVIVALYKAVSARLLHNLREKDVYKWKVKWDGSFISNRTTTLVLPGYNKVTFLTQSHIF
jgi:hypothetical protein